MQESTNQKVKIVFQAIIPHSDPDIDRLMNQIGANFRILEAREKLRSMVGTNNDHLSAFDYHLHICNEFESLLKYLSGCDFSLHPGTELSIRNDTIKAKIDRFRYDHYPMEWTIVVKCFLQRINH